MWPFEATKLERFSLKLKTYGQFTRKPLKHSKMKVWTIFQLIFSKRFIKNTTIDEIFAKFLANPDICGSILQFQWIFTTTQTTKIQKQNFHTIVLLTWHEQPQKTKEKAIFISHFNIELLSFFTRFYDHRNKFYSFISWSHRY